MPKNDKGEETFTFAMCGGGGVGKSSITIRWTQDTFIEIYDPTIENTFNIARKVDNKTSYLTIIDTAGQDEFSALQDVYMRTAYGFVLIFDCTSFQSLEELQKYTERISRIKLDVNKTVDGKECPILIVGNKVDMVKENPKLKGAVSEKEAREFIRSKLLLPDNVPLIFASAKSSENLKECFESIVREMREFEKGQQPKENPFNDEKKKRRGSGGGLFASVSGSTSKDSDLKNVQEFM